MALENNIRRDFLLLLLFTGLRRGSAAESLCEYIDFKKRTLHIPNPKGGEEMAFTLPLSDYLVDLLKGRKKENKDFFLDSPWVFPAHSKSGHIAEPKAKLSIPFTPHDLRRTFITVVESLGTPPYVIKLLANHTLPSSDITATYIQIDVERLRVPMQQITDQLLKMMEPTEGKVLEMKAQ